MEQVAAPEHQYGPLTKSINLEETLMLIELSRDFESVAAWEDEGLFRLPQASRWRRKEIVGAARRKFLEVEGDRFVETPLRSLLTLPTLGARLKRDLLLAQYLRTTPLVWEAVQCVVLPRAKAAAATFSEGAGEAEITIPMWMDFLDGRLNTTTPSTVNKTRRHITAHLTKFGLLEAQPVPGQRFAKRFFARFYEPEPGAFWFSLALEYAERGWTSRSLDYVSRESWTRVAYCTTPAYARFVMTEAERAGVLVTEFFGSEKQVTLRGAEPLTYIVEAIAYG